MIIQMKIFLSKQKIVDSFSYHPAVKYYKNESNIGGSLSRNAGISKSEGDFIAFLDDDDYFWRIKSADN